VAEVNGKSGIFPHFFGNRGYLADFCLFSPGFAGFAAAA
jgi:hypothetical protein